MPHMITLEAEHIEVLRGIERCADGRAYALEEAVRKPTDRHRRALVSLHRAQYVRRRWTGQWLVDPPVSYYFVTRPGKRALAEVNARERATETATAHTT